MLNTKLERLVGAGNKGEAVGSGGSSRDMQEHWECSSSYLRGRFMGVYIILLCNLHIYVLLYILNMI